MRRSHYLNYFVKTPFFNFDYRLGGGGEKRKGSISSEMRLPPESDTESIADYADGNDAGKNHACTLSELISVHKSIHI